MKKIRVYCWTQMKRGKEGVGQVVLKPILINGIAQFDD